MKQIKKNLSQRLSKLEEENKVYYDHLINKIEFPHSSLNRLSIQNDHKTEFVSSYQKNHDGKQEAKKLNIVNQNKEKFQDTLPMNINTVNRQDFKKHSLKEEIKISVSPSKEQARVNFPHTAVSMNQYMYLNWKTQKQESIEPHQPIPFIPSVKDDKVTVYQQNFKQFKSNDHSEAMQILKTHREGIFKSPMNPHFKIKIQSHKNSTHIDFNKEKEAYKNIHGVQVRLKQKQEKQQLANYKNMYRTIQRQSFDQIDPNYNSQFKFLKT